MRVLMLGMPRTGTMSLITALGKLGYRSYHMVEAVKSAKSAFPIWTEGLNAQYHGKGEKLGKEEFDRLLGKYDAVADAPCVCFAEDLIAAYPDAKVILNTRDVDRWLESMDSTVGRVLRWQSWSWLAPWNPYLSRPIQEWLDASMPEFFGTYSDFSPSSPARDVFFKHYDRVRAVTPPERLLEYKIQDGWDPICTFLGVPVPEEEFPRVNDAKKFVLMQRIRWYLSFGQMLFKIGLIAAPVLGVVWMFVQENHSKLGLL